MLRKGLQLNTAVGFLSVVSGVFERLVNIRIVDHIEKSDLFSDFQYGFRSFQSTGDVLTAISDRIARAFNKSGVTRAVALDIFKALTGFGMLFHFTNVSLMEFQVRHLTLFLLFSVTDCFEWFWMESLHKNIQLILEFLKAPFVVVHFSCCILVTVRMTLSVILLSMLIILLSILTVIRHLICDNNFKWLLNLNLICETLRTRVRSGLLISMLRKLSCFRLTRLITMVLLM